MNVEVFATVKLLVRAKRLFARILWGRVRPALLLVSSLQNLLNQPNQAKFNWWHNSIDELRLGYEEADIAEPELVEVSVDAK